MSVQEDVISSTPSPDTFEEEFQIEKIVDKRIKDGKVFYRIKWHGFEDQDTWEPERHVLDCPELIKDYEESVRDQLEEGVEEGLPGTSNNSTREISTNDECELSEETNLSLSLGFERGLEPQKILGATDCDGELCFLMKWKGSDVTDIVRRDEANAKCPQIVIKFYEDRIMWNTRSLEEILE